MYDFDIIPHDLNKIIALGIDWVPFTNTGIMTLFNTDDGGGNWASHTISEKPFDPIALKVNPSNNNVGYVSARSRLYSDNSKSFLFKTENGGLNWKEITGSIKGDIYDIDLHPVNSDRVYVMTTDGLFRSIDQGVSWEKIYSGDIRSIKIAQAPTQRIYIGGLDGVFFSDDKGANWVGINRGLDSLDVRTLDISTINSYIYAGTYGGGLYRISSKFLYVPVKPKKLKALPRTGNSVLLKWKDKSKNEDGFRIERRAVGKEWFEIALTGPNKRKFADKNIEKNEAYEYRICATNLIGDSAYSNIAKVKTK